jgi:hypothetical protein
LRQVNSQLAWRSPHAAWRTAELAAIIADGANVSQPLPPPKKNGDVTEYEIEVTIDEIEEPIEVPMLEKNTRVIVKLRPSIPLFSV